MKCVYNHIAICSRHVRSQKISHLFVIYGLPSLLDFVMQAHKFYCALQQITKWPRKYQQFTIFWQFGIKSQNGPGNINNLQYFGSLILLLIC